MRVVITGANGFIGSALCSALVSDGVETVGTTRRRGNIEEKAPCEMLTTGSLETYREWDSVLEGVDAVVHLAARVHIIKEKEKEPLSRFRLVNVAATRSLAIAAAKAEVKRFIFLSSVGVNGQTTDERPFTEEDIPKPYNDYSLSKWEAEQELCRISRETKLETVILRAPLVYGPDGPGNFRRLMDFILRGWPLPLASVNNQRSFIYLGNLIDAIIACIHHRDAANQTFLIADDEIVSTPQLIRQLAEALGRPARLVPFQTKKLLISGKILGKASVLKQLTGSLVIDSGKIRNQLYWAPPYTMKYGINDVASRRISIDS